MSQLAERAKCLVRDLDPTNELTFVRIASKKHEVGVIMKALTWAIELGCIVQW